MHNPEVPETLEGWSILHQMFRLNWAALREIEPDVRHALAKDAATHVAASGQVAGARSFSSSVTRAI